MTTIEFVLNGKSVKAKPNESFGDVFDNNCQGKFQDKEWVINNKLNPTIAKATKIQNIITPGANVQVQPKGTTGQQPGGFPQQGQQPPPPFGQQPPPPFGQQPPPPFGQQPPPPFGQQPQSPFAQNQQPGVQASQQFNQQPKAQIPGGFPQFQMKPQEALIKQKEVKRQGQNDRSGTESVEKSIKGFRVTIRQYGSEVLLEKETGEFKARFLEEQVSESEQCKISITPQEVIVNPEEQVKLEVGYDRMKNTKVLFLTGYRGIAIRWYTGLQTKFEFWIDE